MSDCLPYFEPFDSYAETAAETPIRDGNELTPSAGSRVQRGDRGSVYPQIIN